LESSGLTVQLNKSGCTLTSTPSGTTAYLTASPGWSNIGGIYGYYNCGGGVVTEADIETDITTNGVGTTVATASVMSYTTRYGNFNCKSSFYYDAALDMYVPPNGWLANFGANSEYQTYFYCPGGPTAGGAGGAAAVGDPHLQNVHGERFDLMKPGTHVLINIPRGVSGEKSLLRVQADARHLGGQCADMYFQEVNITGSWAEANKAGGYHYSVTHGDGEAPEWVAFGKVGLKIVHGRTDSGLSYLNVYVKHLGRAGFAVGGLLGEDDHEDVITPAAGCAKRMSLLEITGKGGQKAPLVLSVAEATLA